MGIVPDVGTVDSTSLGHNSSSAAEQLGAGGSKDVVAELKEELKKMNKKLKNLVNLKNQSNLMAAIFYFCTIALEVVYLLIIRYVLS